ncbi:MAG: RNA polymerase factor sigma-54 [Phycisphaerae bacterium]|nr:RNA polymerase factor sigma-54 [Phycisphaerae bacterium]
MRLNVSQHLGLHQQMKLAPRIIQAMEILQLPLFALQERIDAEMEANPVLETQALDADIDTSPDESETSDRGERDMVVNDDSGNSDDFERLSEFTEEYGVEFNGIDAPPRSAAQPSGERDRKLDAMANTPAPGESLDQYLMGQWAFIEASDPIKAAGELIISLIDDDGYLRTELAGLVSMDGEGHGFGEELLREALAMVQTLEPVGVGARNLAECLMLQLQAESQAGMDVSLEMLMVSRFLRDIEMNRLPKIAQRSGKSIEEIKEAIDNLSHLNPRPGLLIAQRSAPVITPEILVDIDRQGQLVVSMADDSSPQLCISEDYRRLARDRKTEAATRRFLQKNIRSAQWLVEAIAQRKRTIQRVAAEVFIVQRGFLDNGKEELKPLPMADIAAKVGVHVATVSRAVSGKYVQTPRGIYPLRMFFSGGTKTSEGKDVAWDVVRTKLQEVIDNEDKSKPLNDDKLAAELSRQGFTIARRTVAKYRRILNIPSARKRTQF